MKISAPCDLPPVLAILLAEKILPGNVRDAAKRIEGMRGELTRQALWTLSHYQYAIPEAAGSDRFISYPMAGIDPLGENGACDSVDCRMHAAVDFARTIGLYSDVTVLSDPFTALYLQIDRKLTTNQLLYLLTRIAVAQMLEPFMRVGVIRFRSGYLGLCTGCFAKLESKVDATVARYLSEYGSQLKVEVMSGDTIALDFGNIVDPHLIYRTTLGKRSQRRFADPAQRPNLINEIAHRVVFEHAHEAVVGASRAADLGAVVLSNSRAGLSAMLDLENRLPRRTELDIWEHKRSAELPWIKSLLPAEILQLRDEAHQALPRFRARLARTLRTRTANDPANGDSDWGNLIDDLREEAAEVRAELDAIELKSERKFRNVAGAAGLGVALYGLLADVPAVSFASLISVLGLVHTVGKREEQEHAKLTSRPGYVLVKAAEILRHRHA